MMTDTVEFITADASHASLFPECLSLVDRTQGVGILKLEDFFQRASDPDRLLIITLTEGRVIGAATARLLPPNGFTYYERFGKEAVHLLFRDNKVGSLDFASVTELWQGRGIGRELGRRRLSWLQEMGCTASVGISWESGRRSSDRVYQWLGFERLSRMEEFYVEMSHERGFICPVCGPPPCLCAASLYVKRFAAIEREPVKH